MCLQNGRFNHVKDKASVWKDFDVSLHEWLLRLTEEFDLTFPLTDQVNIVPCLLPLQKPQVTFRCSTRYTFVYKVCESVHVHVHIKLQYICTEIILIYR